MVVVLACDVHSVLKGRELYGKAGDKVKVISDCGEVLIVSGPHWEDVWIEQETGKSKRKVKVKVTVKVGEHKYPVNKGLVSK